MKSQIVFVLLLLHFTSMCQSPFTSIKLNMDTASIGYTNYKIEMKICEPKVMTKRGSWFSRDTSKINFDTLKSDDMNCGDYTYNGEGIEVLSGDNPYEKFNSYLYSNTLFAWEKIFIFKISNYSSRAWWPEMYVVLPIKYKAFVTRIELNELTFQSGKIIFLSDINVVSNKERSEITIQQSMKDAKVIEVENFPLKASLRN